MTVEQLIAKLQTISDECGGDLERMHLEMDRALLEYIDNETVTDIFDSSSKW